MSGVNQQVVNTALRENAQKVLSGNSAAQEAVSGNSAAQKESSWFTKLNPFSSGGRRSRVRGGGWSIGSMITPGSYEYTKYAGAGTDCAGTPMRPGFLQSAPSGGLPYRASGGKRSGKRSTRRSRSARHHSARRLRSRKSRGGAAAAASMYDYNIMRSTPGVPIHAGAHTANQKGGRYEMLMGPLVAGSAVGMSGPSMAHSISCEQRIPNPLNQRGGAFPAVHVGAADMMAYQAPNGGYSNQALPLPAGGASPGFLIQVPYAAGSMNRACLTTGGKRSKRNKRSKRSKLSKRNHRK